VGEALQESASPVLVGVTQDAGIAWPERAFDLAVAVLLLPVLAVVGAAISLAIYLDSPGPVIFRSHRVGRGGREFEMLKFRKMRRDSPIHPITLHNDERFTPIGRFLAATRLDELPQFINVLRGDMRLVGPRPELGCFVTEFPDEYAEILTVTPGITGNAQLLFFNERWLLTGSDPHNVYSEHVLPAKIEIDIAYARSHSLAGDAALLMRTVSLPFQVLWTRIRESRTLRQWAPAAASVVLLAAVFVLFSSRLS
jgi:lipopolysaccharide/colanic/teichoic acid biosynthesis glycosyltransferase